MKNVPYPYTIKVLSEEEGGGFFVEFPDLPGCYADGETIDEALKEAKDALNSWIEAARLNHDFIPDPFHKKESLLNHDHDTGDSPYVPTQFFPCA